MSNVMIESDERGAFLVGSHIPVYTVLERIMSEGSIKEVIAKASGSGLTEAHVLASLAYAASKVRSA